MPAGAWTTDEVKDLGLELIAWWRLFQARRLPAEARKVDAALTALIGFMRSRGANSWQGRSPSGHAPIDFVKAFYLDEHKNHTAQGLGLLIDCLPRKAKTANTIAEITTNGGMQR